MGSYSNWGKMEGQEREDTWKIMSTHPKLNWIEFLDGWEPYKDKYFYKINEETNIMSFDHLINCHL